MERERGKERERGGSRRERTWWRERKREGDKVGVMDEKRKRE